MYTMAMAMSCVVHVHLLGILAQATTLSHVNSQPSSGCHLLVVHEGEPVAEEYILRVPDSHVSLQCCLHAAACNCLPATAIHELHIAGGALATLVLLNYQFKRSLQYLSCMSRVAALLAVALSDHERVIHVARARTSTLMTCTGQIHVKFTLRLHIS
jgi:hypothetical protein